MKKMISLLLALALALTLCACVTPKTPMPIEDGDKSAAQPVTVRLGGLKGPTSMGMVKLFDDADNGLGQNAYMYTIAASANELTPQLVQGELDVLAVPANVAAILYNQTEGGVVLLAAGTLGVLYIVEKGGETVTDIASLNGKTIYATGKGATPEYALTYLLSQHGLTLGEDVQVEWKSEPTEIVALMAEQDNAVAMLPQPFVTVAQSQVEGLRVALDMSAEWDALDNGSRLITSVLVARKAFADEHPAALAAFLEDYAASTDYANEHPAEAAVLVEKYGIVKAAVAEKALPQCNLVCITGVDMKVAVGGYLQTLYDLKTEAVGGAMPGRPEGRMCCGARPRVEALLRMSETAKEIPVTDDIINYTMRLVSSTQPSSPEAGETAARMIRLGASPRAAQALITCAKVRAMVSGRFNVSHEDIDALACPVLRHRVKLSYEAMAERVTPDEVIARLVDDMKKKRR